MNLIDTVDAACLLGLALGVASCVLTKRGRPLDRAPMLLASLSGAVLVAAAILGHLAGRPLWSLVPALAAGLVNIGVEVAMARRARWVRKMLGVESIRAGVPDALRVQR